MVELDQFRKEDVGSLTHAFYCNIEYGYPATLVNRSARHRWSYILLFNIGQYGPEGDAGLSTASYSYIERRNAGLEDGELPAP